VRMNAIVRTAVAGRVRLGAGRTPLPPAPTLEFVASTRRLLSGSRAKSERESA
jgi:hypothetical protein